jgi:hypothetical protein
MNNPSSSANTASDKTLFNGTPEDAGFAPYAELAPWRIRRFNDVATGAVLFLASLALYSVLGHGLAGGRYLDYYNLAFDFDPYLYVSTLVLDPADKVGFKHPLIVALRPISQLLLFLGVAPKTAAVITMCLFGAATNVLVWCFLRLQSIDRVVSFLLTVLFGISSTTVITAIVPESYGISNFAIVLTWLVALSCMQTNSTGKPAVYRYAAALVLAGTTITNVVQSAIAEFCVSWQRETWQKAVGLTVRFGWKFCLLFLLAAFAVWHAEIAQALRDPIAAAKQIWWLQTKGEKSGLVEILRTFFVYSFIAPEFSTVTFANDEAGTIFTRMLDFRAWRFGGAGATGVVLWLGGLSLGIFSLFRGGKNMKLYLGIIAALLFNILFHTQFQFRGSLYLYAAHTHFLVFALFSSSALLAAGTTWRRPAYIVALLSVIVATGMNNLPLFERFADGFAQPATNCQAPCK